MSYMALKSGNLWRVVEVLSGKIAKQNGSMIDAGGYGTKAEAERQARRANKALKKGSAGRVKASRTSDEEE